MKAKVVGGITVLLAAFLAMPLIAQEKKGEESKKAAEPEKAKAILGVPHDQHVDVAISFGYPLPGREQSHRPKPNGRKPFDEVVFWERWGG